MPNQSHPLHSQLNTINHMLRSYSLIAVLVLAIVPTLDADETSLVIHNATIFDATSGKMLPRRTIQIRSDRIHSVAESNESLSIPDGAEVIDGTGKFVIPGLIDAHVHLVHLADRTHVTGDEYLPMFLAAGVTSVRSTGDAIVAEAGVAHFAASHPQLCPRVFLASPLIDGAQPVHRDVGYPLTDPMQVAAFVDDMAAWNVTTLKIYVGTPREIGHEVIKQAHRHGMKVTAHLGRYTAQDAAVDGIDCLEHIWSVFNYSIPAEVAKQPDHRAQLDLDNSKCRELVALLANRQVAVDPTLVVFRNMIYLNDLEEVHKHPDVARVPKRMLRYWERYRAGSALQPSTRETRLREILKYQELTGILHRFGVPILAGTDTPEPYVVPGFSMHQELQMLVESGLTPADALQAATINNARMLNQSEHLGSIESGKWADLVILNADPIEDIQNTRQIDSVVRSGHIAKPAALLRRIPVD